MTKVKTAYKNKGIKAEKLSAFSCHLITPPVSRSVLPVVTKKLVKEFDEKEQDLEYWLSRPVKERLAAVNFIISQSLKKGQRMDKTIVHFKKMKRA